MQDLYFTEMNSFNDLSSSNNGFLTFIAVITVIFLAVSILQIVAKWKIFSKAGEPGWAALIPFYKTYMLYKITWENGLFFLLSYIPCLNMIVTIMTNMKLASVFGKNDGFAIGLSFLGVIFYPVLAFDSSEYDGPFCY